MSNDVDVHVHVSIFKHDVRSCIVHRCSILCVSPSHTYSVTVDAPNERHCAHELFSASISPHIHPCIHLHTSPPFLAQSVYHSTRTSSTRARGLARGVPIGTNSTSASAPRRRPRSGRWATPTDVVERPLLLLRLLLRGRAAPRGRAPRAPLRQRTASARA